jgi:hypothetical protein
MIKSNAMGKISNQEPGNKWLSVPIIAMITRLLYCSRHKLISIF